MPKSFGKEQFIARYHSEGFEVLDPPDTIKNRTDLTIKCPKGHVFVSQPRRWSLGRRCHVCHSQLPRKDWEGLFTKARNAGFKIERQNDRVVGVCPVGHSIDVDAFTLSRGRSLCGKCGHQTGGKKHRDRGEVRFKARVEELGFKQLSQYLGQHANISLECEKGHQWSSIAQSVFTYGNCPSCSNNGTSKPEQEILDYVRSLGVEVEHKTRNLLRNPKTGYKMEVDIFAPSKQLAIEFHGLYWHSSGGPNFKEGASALKAELAHEAGLKFFCIFEDEWRHKKELIKSMIRYRLGLFNGRVLNARDLVVKRLNKNKDFEHFFERNHLDGHRQARFVIGLFLGDKLVQAASFSKAKGREALECIRLATDYDYQVRGGAARIFAQIKEPIVSYSNNRLSDGNVYRTLGFKETTQSKLPSYWYTDLEVRIWRYRCRKSNDPDIVVKFPTEKDQALGGVFGERIFGKSKPLYRIEDCGHKRWERA